MAKKKGEISKFRKKRKKQNRTKVIILAAFLIVIVYFVFSGIKIVHLNTEKARVEEKNKQLKEKIENLNQQLEAINSPEFIERLARKNLKLVKQGELMFILPNLRENDDDELAEEGPDSADKGESGGEEKGGSEKTDDSEDSKG